MSIWRITNSSDDLMFFVRHTGYQTTKFDSNTTSDFEVHLNVTLQFHFETAPWNCKRE